MSAAFNGHSFYERGSSGREIPGWEKKWITVVKIIPNGSPVVQAIGADVQRMAMPIRCTHDELADLYDDIDGDTHDLDWSDGSDSALLESITGRSEVMPGNDVYFAVLNLIRA